MINAETNYVYAAGGSEAKTTFTKAKSDCPWKTELGIRGNVAGELRSL